MNLAALKHIILSRTDNMGDVVLSLPVAGYLKKSYPHIKISFIGKAYTRPIIEACKYVDEFIDREELLLSKNISGDAILFLYPDKAVAQIAANNIKIRIGTANRWYHWIYTNKKIFFSRKKSDLHEAQLNFKLLEGLGIYHIPTLHELPAYYGMIAQQHTFSTLFSEGKKHIILHPKSKGSAREWPMSQYSKLSHALVAKGCEVFITGTAFEGEAIQQQAPEIFNDAHIHNVTGRFDLQTLISFIAQADALVACSTGPLHISAALGKPTVGLYPPRKPIHPGRWAALGEKVSILTLDKNCEGCEANGCACIEAIDVNRVLQALQQLVVLP